MGVGSRRHAIHSGSLLNASSQENISCVCECYGFLPETSKLQRGKKSVPWADVQSFFGITELGPFAVKEESVKRPVGLYPYWTTVFHSAEFTTTKIK